MNSNITWMLYDAELIHIERDLRVVVFRAGSRVHVLPTAAPLRWQVGRFGRLTLNKQPAEYAFHEYPDQRLRRLRVRDDTDVGRWAWTLAGTACVIHAKAGAVPDKNGTVIPADTEIFHLVHPGECI